MPGGLLRLTVSPIVIYFIRELTGYAMLGAHLVGKWASGCALCSMGS